jgi:hypothetical protein
MDDQARLALLAKLNEIIGPEQASTLMASLSPHQWNDLATKEDLRALEQRLEARILTELHQELTRQTRTFVLAIVATVIALSGVTVSTITLVAG